MKKKGLIISTVVMVVVLIASLTTATYAWFTASGSASVEDITFKVTASSDLVIGVSKTNTIVTGNPQWANFVSDQTEYNATVATGNRGTWTGATDGLGLSVDTGLQLENISKAVYSFTNVTGEGTEMTGTQTAYEKGEGINVTKGFDPAATALLASGTGNTISAGTYEAAIRNENYLDVVFGVSAAKSDVLSFGCLVTIDNNNALTSLGMNAAIHVAYSFDGTSFTELDVFGNNRAGDPISGMTAPTGPEATIGGVNVPYESTTITGLAKGDATVWIPLATATSNSDFAKTGIEGLKQLHLIIYICGPDSDCVSNAEANSLIKIEFLSVNKGMYDAKANG